jgi:hypothetical protein
MCIKSYIKPSPDNFLSTPQELAVFQLLVISGVSFSCQHQLSVGAQYFIIDFFLKNSILLECSTTTMLKSIVALKNKALQLELKFKTLKVNYPYTCWVLFEASRPISPRMQNRLSRLMPSVDAIFTTKAELAEAIWRIYH